MSIKLILKKKRRLGHIDFLHTFGRDMKWNPHIHVLIAEKYLNNKNELKKFDFFSFDFLRKTYKYMLFNNIYAYFKTILSKEETKKIFFLLKELNEKYSNGCYVYGKKFSKEMTTSKDIVTLTNYVARYASHPPISEKRILEFDEIKNTVTWYYDPHEDDDTIDEDKKISRQIITEDVFDFMKRLIIHVADKGFQQIRYYGFYSNKFANKITNSLLFSKKVLNK